MKDDFLSLERITKRFPGVLALNNITFSLKQGEVHALIGENGAGKSTLMNILGGMLQPDDGEIQLDGCSITIASPSQAFDYGIGFVHQESNLLSNLTVLENVFLARERTRMAHLDKQAMRKEILLVNQKLGYSIHPDARVETLSLAEKQCVEITRSLIFSPRILILDEPTAALDEDEVKRLFRIIRTLRDEGVAVIYISHRLNEIFQIADRITVLKDGQLAGVRRTEEVTKDDLITLMVGRVLEDIYPDRKAVHLGKPLLQVEHLSIPGRLQDVSFLVHAGEIVGLGGLEGHGQRDIARAIFGEIGFPQGAIAIDGVLFKGTGIRSRIRHGVGYVTHDRRNEGLIFTQSLKENCAVASLYKRSHMGFVDAKEEIRQTKAHVKQMQIKAGSIEHSVSNLSGGNQQKVMLARWLMTKPKVLIIDEPTKGVDVGARMSVYQIVNDLTKQGIAILMLTSDMMELIGLSDRILVMCEGRITDEILRSEATEKRIMRAASSTAQGEANEYDMAEEEV